MVGTIKRAESYSITVDLAVPRRLFAGGERYREMLRQGDRVRVISLMSARNYGAPDFPARAANEFMAKLFTQEVPEIYDGIIEIKGVAREPGFG